MKEDKKLFTEKIKYDNNYLIDLENKGSDKPSLQIDIWEQIKQSQELKPEETPKKVEEVKKVSKYSGTFAGIKKKANKYTSTNSQKPIASKDLKKSLKITDNGWKSSRNSLMGSGEKENIVNFIRNCMNKLTESNYEKIIGNFDMISIENEDQLKEIVKIIFDKAISEKMYCHMYAKLCNDLKDKLVLKESKISFRNMFINECQNQFESDEKTAVPPSHIVEEMDKEEWKYNQKQRMLGNMNLIAELFKINVLCEKIIYSCIQKLIGDVNEPNESYLELLCKLISGLGKKIDNEKNKDRINSLFNTLDTISTKVCRRICFMIQDLKMERQNGWRSKQQEIKEIEKKISSTSNEKIEKEKTEKKTPNGKRIIVVRKSQNKSNDSLSLSNSNLSLSSTLNISSSPNNILSLEDNESFTKIKQNFEEYFENDEIEELEYSLSHDFGKEKYPFVFAKSLLIFSNSPKKYALVVNLILSSFKSSFDNKKILSIFHYLFENYSSFNKDYPKIDEVLAFSLSKFFPSFINLSFFSSQSFLDLRDVQPSHKQPSDKMGTSAVLFTKFCEFFHKENGWENFKENSSDNFEFNLKSILKSGSVESDVTDFSQHYDIIQKFLYNVK